MSLKNTTMGGLEWALLITLTVLWSMVFLFTAIALDDLPPFTLVLGRVGFAAVALLALVYWTGNRMPTNLRPWLAFFAMGALNNLIPFSLIVYGQTQIASGLASILNATTPLFTVLLAHLLTADEKLTVNRLAGVVVGLVGVTVMIGGEMLAGLGLHVIAQVAILGAALSYACAGIYGRRFRQTPPLVTAAGQVTASALMLAPIVLVVDQPWLLAAPGPATWAAVAALALACTAAAYVIYFRILASAGATNVLLVTFMMPIGAVCLGALVLGERLEPKHFIGMALIGLGLAAIDGRLLGLVRRRKATVGAD